MPTKTTGNNDELLPGSIRHKPKYTPPPGTRSKGGEAMLHCFREEEEKTRGARKNLFIYESQFCVLTILMDSQVSKSYVLKQRFLILFLASPCSAHSLHLSLSFTSSDQLQQTVPIIQLFSHSYEKHYTWSHVRLPCCIKALIRIKPYIKS